MNCRDLQQWLSEGKALTGDAKAHIQGCAGCQSLVDALGQEEYPVESELVSRVTATLTRQLRPVTPLPSDRTLTVLIFALFVAFCLMITTVVGFFGYAAMTPAERGVYYGIIGIFGLLFSNAAVATAIPAAKVRMPVYVLAGGCVMITALAVSAMFPNIALDQFVRRGIPCLRLGCICAALFGIVSGLLLRRGYVTDPRRAALLISCFAGFSGVAVLSLHCPLQDALHIIVWHLGTVLVSASMGLAIAVLFPARA